MLSNYDKYLKKLSEGFKPAIKILWLNPDETVAFEITNQIHNINVSINVNYQNGLRRTCTIVLGNDNNKNPINYNNIWIGSKFKVYMGVYLDDNTPYYYPQGVFCVTSPQETYRPNSRLVTLQGSDKWCLLDGTLYGYLRGTYQTNIGVNLFESIKAILKQSRYDGGETTDKTRMLDPATPVLSNELFKRKDGVLCPYTSKIEAGKTYADVLLEFANIMVASVYYDVNGRLVFEPLSDEYQDLNDSNKSVLWNFTVENRDFLGSDITYNFKEVYNDVIVLGNIMNGYQAKARVQNRNPKSNTCIDKIGLKTRPPYESSQYYSDEQCEDLAKYYAKLSTIMQKSGSFESTPIYHLDVNKLCTLSSPSNNMSKEKYLITGLNISSFNNMTIDVTKVSELESFEVVKGDF